MNLVGQRAGCGRERGRIRVRTSDAELPSGRASCSRSAMTAGHPAGDPRSRVRAVLHDKNQGPDRGTGLGSRRCTASSSSTGDDRDRRRIDGRGRRSACRCPRPAPGRAGDPEAGRGARQGSGLVLVVDDDAIVGAPCCARSRASGTRRSRRRAARRPSSCTRAPRRDCRRGARHGDARHERPCDYSGCARSIRRCACCWCRATRSTRRSRRSSISASAATAQAAHDGAARGGAVRAHGAVALSYGATRSRSAQIGGGRAAGVDDVAATAMKCGSWSRWSSWNRSVMRSRPATTTSEPRRDRWRSRRRSRDR